MTETPPNPAGKNWRKIVPETLRKERGIYLRLGPKAGAIYARLRLLALLGVHTQRGPKVSNGHSILFVCFGNIMRSPMAEALLRAELPRAEVAGFTIASAGLHAIPGNAAHPWALEASREFGISLDNHRAVAVTPELIAKSDLIFAMDFQNQAELLAQYPDAAGRIFVLGVYTDGSRRDLEIPDPYFGDVDATRECYRVLQVCTRNLAAELLASSSNPALANRIAVGS